MKCPHCGKEHKDDLVEGVFVFKSTPTTAYFRPAKVGEVLQIAPKLIKALHCKIVLALSKEQCEELRSLPDGGILTVKEKENENQD